MDLLKKIAMTVISGAVVLAVLALGISWFQMTPAERSGAYAAVGHAVAWVGIVAMLPWATFFVTTAAARRDTNAAGALLVAGYTLVDALILLWLTAGHPGSTLGLALMIFGLLAATAYNLLACDFIAEKA